jgi:hypothetical protein
MKERANQENVIVLMKVAKLFFCGILMGHLAACSYYLVGSQDGGWVERESIRGFVIGAKYLYTAYRLMSTLHPSSMRFDMHDMTNSEKVYGIFATGCALGLGATITSVITNQMADVKRVRQERTNKLTFIREYVQTHGISPHLTMQLKKYIITGYAARLQQKAALELMAVLPQGLVMELKHESWSPLIIKHPLFEVIHKNHNRTEVDICFRSLSESYVVHDEHLFKAGDVCGRMIFLCSGTMRYQHGTRAKSVMDMIEPGQHLCEGALWVHWENCGELVAESVGSVLRLEADSFQEVVHEHEIAYIDIVPHAREFVRRLNASEGPITDFLSSYETSTEHV